LIVGEKALKDHKIRPIARIVSLTVTAGDPVIMLEEPVNTIRRALNPPGLTIQDINLYEVNEAFAPVPLAWLQAIGADLDKLNVSGGAIAIGHPPGASGTKLLSTLVHALKARGKRY
jgi:acetyl-CoA C-acetyltransferase